MSQHRTSQQPRPYQPTVSDGTVRRAFRNGKIPVAVYGLGKIGLPVASVFAERTGNVLGVDTDPDVVNAVQSGVPPFDHEPGLDEALPTLVSENRLEATTDGEAASNAAMIHVIVVPVPIDDTSDADLAAIDAVVDTIATGISPGDLVVVETTVPPGTCEEHVQPRLIENSGLETGTFGVASCPERTASGRAMRDVRGAYQRVLGGVDKSSTTAATRVYDELIDNEVIAVDARTAEAVKLFEGVYRDVNIALANELAVAFEGCGIDVLEAIDAANTQPYCDIHRPGAGVGGHCIPWYPYFLMHSTSADMPIVRTARTTNERMPLHVADRTLEAIRATGRAVDDTRIAVLGLAYRPDVPETAASPTIPLVERLTQAGADVRVIDPVVTSTAFDLLPMDEVTSYSPDAVVVVTPHTSFDELPTAVLEDALLIDGRDAFDTLDREYVVGRHP